MNSKFEFICGFNFKRIILDYKSDVDGESAFNVLINFKLLNGNGEILRLHDPAKC